MLHQTPREGANLCTHPHTLSSFTRVVYTYTLPHLNLSSRKRLLRGFDSYHL